MTKKEFDSLFQECFREVLNQNAEGLLPKIKEYASENGKISMEQLAIFVYMESLNTNKELLYSVLTKTFFKD